MGRTDRFVLPDVVRLPISDGDWVEVKRDLNVGDQKRLDNAGLLPPTTVEGNDGERKVIYPIDWAVFEIERTAIWMVGWSLHGPDDKPVDLTMDALRALDTETFAEINEAVFDHAKKVTEEKKARTEARKKTSMTAPPKIDS